MNRHHRQVPSTPKRVFYALSLLLLSIGHAQAENCRVAVAANFTSTLQQLKTVFETSSEHSLTLISGSTGKLFAQIENGAPFDVFLAADRQRPEALIASGKAVANTNVNYALGQLVYWQPDSAQALDTQPPIATVRSIAIANPRTAPYGQAALSALVKLGFEGASPTKLVYGNNINQSYQYIASHNVEAGFIALSQLREIKEAQRGYWWLVPSALHPAIEQQAVLLKNGQSNKAAVAFLNFLGSAKATAMIRQMGYSTP